MLLASDRDGGDVPRATRLRECRPECLPPFAWVGFARAAFTTDRVPGAAAGDDAARLRIDHQHLRRLGRRIDARNERAHGTSAQSATTGGHSAARIARLHHAPARWWWRQGPVASSADLGRWATPQPPRVPRRDSYAGALSPGAPLTQRLPSAAQTPRLRAVPCPEAAAAGAHRRDRRPKPHDQGRLIGLGRTAGEAHRCEPSTETHRHSENERCVRHDGPS